MRPRLLLAVAAVTFAAAFVAALTWDRGSGDDVAARAAEETTEAPTTAAVPSTTPAPTTTTTTAPASTTTTEPVDVLSLRPPPPATTPEGLAQQIAEAEAVIRSDDADEVALAEAALAQQVAYRELGAHPEWDAAVLASVPEHLRESVQRHAAARREFRGMHSKLPTTLPPWQIVAPEPADQLLAYYQEAEAAFGVPWRYLAAVHLVETATGRIRGTSVAGAQGPMQFMPATWAAYGGGGDINDTHDAIMGAARYLAANNGATDIDNALYRYNHSERYVRGVKLYADLIAEHPGAWRALYHWGVWYLTDQGAVHLPVGYHETEPVPVAEYLSR